VLGAARDQCVDAARDLFGAEQRGDAAWLSRSLGAVSTVFARDLKQRQNRRRVRWEIHDLNGIQSANQRQ
jgi:hypothetical protein